MANAKLDSWKINNKGLEGYYQLRNESLRGFDFSRLRAESFSVRDSELVDCDFSGSVFKLFHPGDGSTRNIFRQCNFKDAKINKSMGALARFEDCCFEDVQIKSWDARKAQFVNCTFSGKIKDVMFGGPLPMRDGIETSTLVSPTAPDAEFRGNDLSRCELVGVSFEHGIYLTDQKLPTGDGYCFVMDGVKLLDRFLKESPEGEIPDRTRIAVEVTRNSLVDRQQRQLLLIRDRWLEPVWDRLVAMAQDDGAPQAERPATPKARTDKDPAAGVSERGDVSGSGVTHRFEQGEDGDDFTLVAESLAPWVADSDDDVLWLEVDGQREALVLEGAEALEATGSDTSPVLEVVSEVLTRHGWVDSK